MPAFGLPVFVFAAAIIGGSALFLSTGHSSMVPLPSGGQAGKLNVAMPICRSGKRVTCVVDGDTVWIGGEKFRLQSFNTPEMQGACRRERELAQQATTRLAALLSADGFELLPSGRNDRYGRSLATIRVSGRDVGDILIAEGLAHRWRGHRRDWCRE